MVTVIERAMPLSYFTNDALTYIFSSILTDGTPVLNTQFILCALDLGEGGFPYYLQ